MRARLLGALLFVLLLAQSGHRDRGQLRALVAGWAGDGMLIAWWGPLGDCSWFLFNETTDPPDLGGGYLCAGTCGPASVVCGDRTAADGPNVYTVRTCPDGVRCLLGEAEIVGWAVGVRPPRARERHDR